MTNPLPSDLETAIEQAKQATRAALEAGERLVQVDLAIPELKAQPIAEQFIPCLLAMGHQLRVFFPDTGAAALARRDWGEPDFEGEFQLADLKIGDMGSRRRPVDMQIEASDTCFLAIEPSDVEIEQVEKLYQVAGDRPVILLLPHLENIATIGIGYAGRQLRERFLNKIETCYYIRPLEGATMYRCYPSLWQVWGDAIPPAIEGELLAETPTKLVGEALERLLLGEEDNTIDTAPRDPSSTLNEGTASTPSSKKRPGIMAGLQSFLKALSQ